MRGSQWRFCASLPYLMSTGPSMFTPNGTMRGASASAHSFSKMNFCTGGPARAAVLLRPVIREPALRVEDARAIRAMSSRVRRRPVCTLSRETLRELVAQEGRTSARKASSSGVKFRSMTGVFQ